MIQKSKQTQLELDQAQNDNAALKNEVEESKSKDTAVQLYLSKYHNSMSKIKQLTDELLTKDKTITTIKQELKDN